MARTLLQVLCFNKSELKLLMTYLQEEQATVQAKLQETRSALSSVQRMTSVLERITNREQTRLKEQLESYPGVEELEQTINQARD